MRRAGGVTTRLFIVGSAPAAFGKQNEFDIALRVKLINEASIRTHQHLRMYYNPLILLLF